MGGTPDSWHGWLAAGALWTMLTAAGWAAGFFLAPRISLFAISTVGPALGQDAGRAAGWVVLGAVAGAVAAGSQSIVLRNWVTGVKWWIIATAVGWALATGWLVGWINIGAIVGGIIGLGQWLILRRWVHRARWWLLGSAVAWTAAQASELLLPFTADVLPVTIAGSVYGAITSLVLIVLFSRSDALAAHQNPAYSE